MIPILYSNDETLFLSNGLGRLSDAISCTVKEERNGIFEAELVYPITGVHYEDIQEGCILYCTHDDSGNPQPFDIYARSAEIDGNVTFYAHHISYRLSNVIMQPFSLTNTSVANALNAMKANAINETPFTLATDKATTGNFAVDEPDSIKARLGGVEGSILDAFDGGEYKYDKFTVTLYAARGVDNGVTIRYGKNLTDITAEKSIEGRYTGVVPFWRSSEGDEMVTLPEWYILTSSMPTEDAYLTDEDDTIIRTESDEPIELTYGVIALVPMDLSDEWEEAPTVTQLRDKATARYNASYAWQAEENIEVNFVALWQSPEYENVAALQRVLLCDTVTVYYPALNVEVSKKVITTEYNVLLDRYDSIELGMAKSSFADVITERTVSMMSKYTTRSFMAAAIDNATSLITGGLGGYVVIGTNANGQPEEILVMDTDDVNTAVNVIRINKNGIGFSSTGYQGPFTSAWTIDGSFVADFITSGTLNANLIKAGTITAADGGGGNSWNLLTGIFTSTDGTRRTQISAGKIRFYKDDEHTGTIGPAAWGGDYDNKEGIAIFAGVDAVYMALGGLTTTDDNVYAEAYIVINKGLNPDGYTEGIIFQKNLRCNNIYPKSGTRILGASDARWYQVWSTSFNFVTGVYINYDSTNDYIYASKTIHQASDEHLKDIRPYDDGYDTLLEQLEPFAYTWKDHPNGKEMVGLGARKTAQLLDDLGLQNSGFVGVNKDDQGNEIYSIDYQELSVMLLHAYQKQKAEVDKLREEVDGLKERLQRICELLEVKNADT